VTENLCVRCGRPTPDGYADVICGVERPRAWLAEIADMVPAARDVAQRQARRGGGGGASGKPGSSLPIDLGATSRLDAVRNELTTRVRHIAEERDVNRVEINGGGLTVAFRGSVWMDQVQGLTDDLGAMALWLADHCEWMRHRPEVDEWLTDVEACARIVRRVADPERDGRVIVGLCDCGKMLYAPKDREVVTCPECEQQWDVDASTEALRDQLNDRLVTAGEAAHLGGYLDTDRSGKQIRSLIDLWVRTERLAHHGEVLIKHKHRPGCESGCRQAIDRIATYRFGDIGELVASTPRRAARAAEMGA
jgi:hypothetical protein